MRRLACVLALSLFAKAAAAQGRVAPELIAAGDSLFKGQTGGATCATCHQLSGKGIPGLAPDLTDRAWLHGDGSLASIARIIQQGVPKPKQAVAPMPPGGGVELTPEQIQALAAYVYSLSRPR